jgi:hypothetical protein
MTPTLYHPIEHVRLVWVEWRPGSSKLQLQAQSMDWTKSPAGPQIGEAE